MSTVNKSLTAAIIKRTHRVPISAVGLQPRSEIGGRFARQLDIALISAGFKASAALLDRIDSLGEALASEITNEIIQSAREIKGDHVEHNVYFKDFPNNVPDTIEFWASLVQETFGEFGFLWSGNLLELDGYGGYRHTYQEMVAAHDPFVASAKDKLTVLHLGGSLDEEAHKLYVSLAGSKVVANNDDLQLLKSLADIYADSPQPEKVPVRENRAVINSVRVSLGKSLLADTVTDVLRLAVDLSGGDTSLQEKTKFKSFTNRERRVLLSSLEDIVSKNKGKLGDVFKHREQFKRLDERLHSGSYRHYENAKKVFRVARDGENLSYEAKLDRAFANKNNKAVLSLLESAPGLFVRSFNRVLMRTSISELGDLMATLEKVLPKVTTPTVLGLRQYLLNRVESKTNRLFINRKGTGVVVPNEQSPIPSLILSPITKLIDTEVASRLEVATYIINRDILNVALPLSNRQTSDGFGVMPRGSTDSLTAEVIRFFTYWKQSELTTDFDLSAVTLDENFNVVGQLSYTNLRGIGGKHSGDVTSAPNGASEFIDIETSKVNAKYIVPQVNVYGGEGFEEVEESFFGYMSRTQLEQKGKPFEARTVKSKAEMRGKNRVSLPLVFIKETDGSLTVKWVNTFIKGLSWGNATENNRLTTATIMRSIVESKYLTVDYITSRLFDVVNTGVNVVYADQLTPNMLEEMEAQEAPVIYVGQEAVEGLPKKTKVITLKNLHELL